MELISRLTAGVLALILAPLLLSIAIANLIVQGRPIIFRQPRIGKNFEVYIKNRGMQNTHNAP